MNSALQINELVNLVCGFICRRDLVRSARTSRQFFDLVIPIIWEHVNEISHFFGLFVGANVSDVTETTGDFIICIVSCAQLLCLHAHQFPQGTWHLIRRTYPTHSLRSQIYNTFLHGKGQNIGSLFA